MKKMNIVEFSKHILENKPDYNAQIIISALHKRIYGVMPHIGMSGMQAECATELEEAMPKEVK